VIIFLPENSTWEVKMVPVEFIIKEGDEHLTSHSGLTLIGALINPRDCGTFLPAKSGKSSDWIGCLKCAPCGRKSASWPVAEIRNDG
jgi:hypothetical protein